ncbi:MAG: polysaccharide deacetylase family protein [Candidatus Margulisiibacteriota bacterium]
MASVFWVILLGLIHPIVAQNSIVSDTEVALIQTNRPQSSVVWHMSRNVPHVALTFDDGPDEIVTPKLLTVLREYNVKATFFLVGHMIAKAPHIVQQITQDGHQIANHTWAHYRLDEMTQDQVNLQISSTHRAVKDINQPIMPYVRPPGGRFNNYVIHATKRQNMTLVMWDVNAADYKTADGQLPDPKAIARRVIRKTRPGSIILMHNGPATVDALPQIITEIKNKSLSIGLLQW